MKLLILSDIHAISSELKKYPEAYSGASGGMHIAERRSSIENRILAIGDVGELRDKEIDAIVVLGDLAHQAKQLVLTQVWQDIHTLAERLAVDIVIGTIGNHDIYSRANSPQEAEDLRNYLKTLVPSFPTADDDINRAYFADGVASLRKGECEIVLINTCELHGLGSDSNAVKQLFQVGNISNLAIEKTKEICENSSATHLIFVLHHHPQKVDLPVDNNADVMERGALFLGELAKFSQPAVVLHGHKHLVSIGNWESDETNPIIFSSSSLAAYAYQGQESYFSNQFHLLEIDLSEMTKAKGKVFSWDWDDPNWSPSSRAHMPFEKPFGFAVDFDDIASRILNLELKPKWTEAELLREIPSLQGYSENDVEELNTRLATSSKLLAVNRGQLFLYYEEDA